MHVFFLQFFELFLYVGKGPDVLWAILFTQTKVTAFLRLITQPGIASTPVLFSLSFMIYTVILFG